MKVKELLNNMAIGRSTINHVVLKDVTTEKCGLLKRENIIDENYLDWGGCKINSFVINDDAIIIYAQ